MITFASVMELGGVAFAAVGLPGMLNGGGSVVRCTLAPAAAFGAGLGSAVGSAPKRQLALAGAAGSNGAESGYGRSEAATSSNGATEANGAPATARLAGGNGRGGGDTEWGDAAGAGVCAEVRHPIE